MKKWIYAISASVFLFVSGCSNDKVSMQHIHGLGYSSDGNQLLIPSHEGLVSFSEGKWQNVAAQKHDYMGFQTVDDGFYSSGHPGSGSTLKNPLGIVKSTDNGKTLTTLGFEGESDFHGMAVGHSNHTIYVVNEQPSSKLDTTGLYYSTDDAKTWTKSAAEGLAEEPAALAVHPEDEKTIAAATKNGLLFSSDNGNHFETLLADQFITALKFSAGGELYAAGANTPNLLKINLTTKETTEMKLPQMDEEDAISYIAENPTDAKEIAIATYKKDVYVSKDSGATWGKIANEGISK